MSIFVNLQVAQQTTIKTIHKALHLKALKAYVN